MKQLIQKHTLIQIRVNKVGTEPKKTGIEDTHLGLHNRFAIPIGYELVYGEVTPTGIDLYVKVIEK